MSVITTVVLVALAQVKEAAPIVNKHEKDYEVAGRSVRELQESLRRNRPPGGYDGMTQWRVSYELESETGSDGACRVTFAQSKIDVTVTLPTWVNWAEGSDSLRASWSRHIRDLRGHEQKHVQNGVAAAAAVQKALYALPAAMSCSALEEAAAEKAKTILKEADRRDREYDSHTLHGLAESPQ